MERTDIAHHEWDRRWQTTEGRSDWLTPDTEVFNLIPVLHESGVLDVLDLGCGVGRHALLFAKEGFNVSAMDGSRSGLDFIEREAEKEQLAITTACAEMTALPFAQQSFDYVLAWNVIYHGNKDIVRQAISEIHRTLRPEGLLQLTMLSDRNTETQSGTLISENTYINPGVSDKSHPHYYCNAKELTELFCDFRVIEQQEKEHARPGSFHWHLLLEKMAR
jgi:tellurite methyltransferase